MKGRVRLGDMKDWKARRNRRTEQSDDWKEDEWTETSRIEMK
jgi:hypothetical protein